MAQKAEAPFSKELQDITKTTATGLCIALGSKMGLIKDLSQREEPATPDDIAKSCRLKERYVREWCAAMATGGILEITPDGEKYFLPVRMREPLLGNDTSCMDAFFLLNAFPVLTGSDHMQRFSRVMKEDGPSGLEFQPEVTVETDAYTFSMKLEVHHMKAMLCGNPHLKEQLEAGISVLELGCNTGVLSFELSKLFPASNFFGVDVDSNAITQAQRRSDATKSLNTDFKVQDITDFPEDWENKFDYIFAFKVIHDVSKPREALKNSWSVLKKGGKFSLFEYNLSSNPAENVDNKLSPGIYLGSLMYCIPYSIGLNNGASLGAAWGIEKMTAYLEEAGFKDIQVVDKTCHPLVHIVAYK